MTTLWTDDPDAAFDESDALWGDEDAEGDLGGEDFGEESRDARLRRERARRNRVALRQQQQAAARAKAVQRRQPSAVSPQRSTAQAVRTLGLENKVLEDASRSAIGALRKELRRAELSAVLTAAVAQGMASFGTPGNDWVAAALRYAPLVVLDPPKHHGVEGWIMDPRVLGAAAVAGLVFTGDHWGTRQSQTPNQIKIVAPPTISMSEIPLTLVAQVLDGKGRPLSDEQGKVTWGVTSTTAQPAKIDGTGCLTPTAPGWVVVTATSLTSSDISNTVGINILPTFGSPPSSGGLY